MVSDSEALGLATSKGSNNINTMLGGMIYELGFIAIIFYYYMYKICSDKRIWFIIVIWGLDGLNITNPYFGILMGLNYFLYKNNNKLKYMLGEEK